MAWTTPTTRTTGTLITASIWNTDLVDNLAYLKNAPAFDGVVKLTAGTAAAPALTQTSDLNTGLYFPSADTLGLTTGGVVRITCNSDGVVVLGTGDSTATPSGNTLRAPHAEGTNIAGGNISFSSGRSTGTANGGAISFSTSPAGGVSGTTLNASVIRLQILSTGNVVLGSGDGSATPAGNTFRAPNAAGTDIAGANLTITAGNGTGTGGSGYIAFQTAAAGSTGTTANTMTERLRIDKGGVSIGGTPFAWGTSFGIRALDIGPIAAVVSSVNVGNLIANCWYNGSNDVYKVNGYAYSYAQGPAGQHAWVTAPSGTASATITWTERMRLTNDGHLAIGALAKLYLDGTAATGNTYLTESAADTISLYANGVQAVQVNNASNVSLLKMIGGTRSTLLLRGDYNGSTDIANLSMANANDTVVANIYATTSSNSGTANGELVFRTASSGTLGERMRITSGGNVHPGSNDGGQLGISGTAWSDLFLASGGVINWDASDVTLTHSANRLTFAGATSNYVFDNGYILIGTTDTSASSGVGLKLRNATTDPAMYLVSDTNTYATLVYIYNVNATNNGARCLINVDGGIWNYQANNSNLSDARLKTDIQPAGSYWDKLKAIEIVTFKYVDQAHDDDNIGVIAQQVEAVAPEFVDVDGAGETPADGVPLKTIYTTDLYHAAIKTLQEAMTRIEALEARLN